MSLRRLTRRVLRLAPPVLLTTALGTYAVSLAQAHTLASHVNERVAFVQRLGAAARTDGAGAGGTTTIERQTGSLELDAPSGVAIARWRLGPLGRDLQAGMRLEDVEPFVVGAQLEFRRPDGYAAVSLDGRTIAVVRPGQRDFPGGRSGPDAGSQMIDVPPGVRPGFRFPASRPLADARGATLAIALHGGRWYVDRAGLRATMRPQVSADRPDAGATFVALLGGAGAAALGHAVLSLARRRRKAGVGAAPQRVRR